MKYYYICEKNRNYDTGRGEWTRYSYLYTYKELIAVLAKARITNFVLNMNNTRIKHISEYEYKYEKEYCIIVYENDAWYDLSEEQLEAIKIDIYKYSNTHRQGYWATTQYLLNQNTFRKSPVYRTGKRKHIGKGCSFAGILQHIRMNTDVDYKEYDDHTRIYDMCKFDRYRKEHIRSWKYQYKVRKQWMIHLK